MTRSFDAIVVGGGHNGLSAAHYLARGGLSVLVLERRAVVAGMLALAIANAGPSTPETAFGLLLRPLSLNSQSVEAEHDPRRQPMRGSTGLPLGGMGSFAEAMERSLRADGVVVRKEAAVTGILTAADGTVRGVVLAGGEEIEARTVLANVNPKTALLGMVGKDRLDADLADDLEALPMSGHAFKLVLALDALPRFAAAPAGLETTYASCQFRIAPSLDYLDRCWADGQAGRPSAGPMFWGLIPTVADPTMAPSGKHMMSVNIWYAPYHLAEGDWRSERERFGEHCIDLLAQYFPNLREIIIDRRFFSPKDLEQEFGLLEAHHLHGDMLPSRMFGARPLPGLAHYRTPLRGLYLCGAGTWPGGFVTGVPGHNAAKQALADLRTGLESSDVGRDFDANRESPAP